MTAFVFDAESIVKLSVEASDEAEARALAGGLAFADLLEEPVELLAGSGVFVSTVILVESPRLVVEREENSR
ncbi:hypothetical protein [Kitasatospora sp. NPDC098663]|uniref:hypothetical protein n=1 Tax=Kitasatospora sp. NPDC098663 TaxID=3364096 RepID=UPI0037FBE5F0